MTRLLRCTLPVLCAGLLFPLAASAQAAPAAGQPATPPPGGQRAPYVPKNLKVLPDNTDLRKVMRDFEGALGVECSFCHVVNPATKRPDPPSDANPVKEVARSMIRLTDDLNEKYLTQLPKAPDLDVNPKISCGTCHRGHSKPEAFVAPPRPEGNRPPGAAAPPAGAPPAAMAPH